MNGGPEPPATAFESIVAAVENDNAERFIVCTQDEALRTRLRKDSPHVPTVFCHTSGLQMEPPVDATASGVASQLEEVEGLPEKERHALKQEEKGLPQVHTNVRYKRGKAKGPNPLSCKPKKRKQPEPAQQKQQQSEQGDGEPRKKRPRRKRRGGEQTGDGSGAVGDGGD